MILAAGRGERMRPLTDHTPKSLLQAGGRSLIEYHVAALAAAGIRIIVINIAHLGEQIVAALGDGTRWGVEIRYSHERAGALETAGGIVHALPLFDSERFVVINADIFTDYAIKALADTPTSAAHLVMVPNPAHHPDGDFRLDGDRVTPLDSGAGTAATFAGIGLCHREFFTGYGPGRRPLGPLLRAAVAAGHISGEYHDGYWMDVGTPERLHDLRRYLGEEMD
jgi:MurNAc alpha-1-phosphate uridylyltransferase